ncbi:MAG: hypothetical protein IPG17_30695 [Sandaracinaceae bacterium]|nr:hypothetical protein [Sandaracinaceae bacterium]
MIPQPHPIAPTRAPERDEPTPHFVRLYHPFVEAMPRWRALLEATNQLLLARTWETVRQAASGLFCGVLGFDEARVSLTRRLTGRSAIEDFGADRVFRWVPRLVRLTRSLSDTGQRLDRCRPALDDDAESLGSRLQAALECEAGALAAGWASRGTVPEGELPGLPLATATRELMQAFLHGEDWCWGLRGHLANLLPLPIKHEALWLDLVAFKQVGAPATPEECWKTARTREQRMTLELALRTWSTLEIVQRLTIPVSVVVPDENGWFWIEGRPHRHVPKVGLDGQLLSRHTLPSWSGHTRRRGRRDRSNTRRGALPLPLRPKARL